jgi:carboxylesterase type B
MCIVTQWTIANIEKFGGDPEMITIIGGSAGAGSVRALLGSPPAIGLYQAAIAVSNLGGGVGLGISGDYATTYSDYDTIAQSYASAGTQVFTQAGCTNATLAAQIVCLKTVDPIKLVGLPTVARYVVQDGTYVVTERLEVTSPSKLVAHVPVIWGNARDDGASFSTYPRTPVTSELAGVQAGLGISAQYAQSIIDSGLFPYHDTGNITLDAFNVSARVTTDLQFRCIDQATAYAGAASGAFERAWYYQMDRTYGGYDPNGLGGPKNNDPNQPYFRLHGAEMPNIFGNLGAPRNTDDLHTMQTGVSYFGAFTRELQPNPSPLYLAARGYDSVIAAVKKTGTWDPVAGKNGPIRHIDYLPSASAFVDVPQCAFLNYSLEYYFTNH